VHKNGERSRKASLPCLAEALAKAERGVSRTSPISSSALLACPAIAQRATADEVAPSGRL
jgi:hypothetical protein